MFKYILPIFVVAILGQAQLSLQDSPQCTICGSIVSQAENLLAQNASEATILGFFKTQLCSRLGNLAFACDLLIDTQGPAIIAEITSENPHSVCVVLGLCSPTLKRDVNDDVQCNICSLAVTQAESLLKQNTSEQYILGIFKTQICSKLGTYSFACDILVDTQGAAIINQLATEDPKHVCSLIGACSQAVAKPVKKSVAPLKGEVCTLCTTVLSAAQSYLEQNATESEVISFLDSQLCDSLGGLASICKQYVNTYGPQIIYQLTLDIHPSIICQSLGLCGTSVQKRSEEPTFVTCSVCKLVLNQVLSQAQNNETEGVVIKVVQDKICGALGFASGLCKSLIAAYTPSIISQLASQVDAEKVCEFAGQCSNKTNSIFGLFSKRSFSLSPQCVLCEYAVQFVDNQLKLNSTETEIIHSLETTCNLLPESVQSDCDSLVSTYGTYIIQFLIQYSDPSSVCSRIQIC